MGSSVIFEIDDLCAKVCGKYCRNLQVLLSRFCCSNGHATQGASRASLCGILNPSNSKNIELEFWCLICSLLFHAVIAKIKDGGFVDSSMDFFVSSTHWALWLVSVFYGLNYPIILIKRDAVSLTNIFPLFFMWLHKHAIFMYFFQGRLWIRRSNKYSAGGSHRR